MKPILTIELVPRTAWHVNIRSEVSKDKWDEIRNETYRKVGHKCEICSGRGGKWPVECHEIWDYDDINHIQELSRFVALCPLCHTVKHIGLAQMKGEYEVTRDHLAKVNEWPVEKAEKYISKQFKVWQERSKHKWEIRYTI